MDINTVTLCGRLTRDAELKYTNSGKAVSKFSLAVNGYKDKETGNTKASFINCVLWGKHAESLSKYLTKGKQINVSGRLDQDRWEKDGQTRSDLKVIVNDLQLLGSGESKTSKPEASKATFQDGIPF